MKQLGADVRPWEGRMSEASTDRPKEGVVG